jgi:SNF2 family DNA or RNA helicase
LQRRYRMRSAPTIISGEVAGGVRQSRVDAFQRIPDGFDAMILSPKAGGVGLTITRANHVLHLTRWWNPAVEDQCNGRAMRIGQTRPVTTYLPMAILPGGQRSFDENLHALLERKRALMREALCPSAVTETEFQDLLDRTINL